MNRAVLVTGLTNEALDNEKGGPAGPPFLSVGKDEGPRPRSTGLALTTFSAPYFLMRPGINGLD
jgi:hypothetical protein